MLVSFSSTTKLTISSTLIFTALFAVQDISYYAKSPTADMLLAMMLWYQDSVRSRRPDLMDRAKRRVVCGRQQSSAGHLEHSEYSQWAT